MTKVTKKDKAKGDHNKQQEGSMVDMMVSPISLKFSYTAGRATTACLRHAKEGRLIGQHSEGSKDVYMPARGSCPKIGQPTTVEVPLDGKGIVESFTVVHIPIPDNPIQPPFVVANILLDGVSTAFIHLVSEVENDKVHIGMRVEPVWKPSSEWSYSLENIRYFKPSGEPSVDVDALRREHHA
jgi:uncharacterized OB-fold protein